MLMISFVPLTDDIAGVFTPWIALIVGVAAYFTLLCLICLQSRYHKHNKERTLLFVNLELLAFILFFHLFLGAYRPLIIAFIPQTSLTVITLLLYFGGIFCHHYSSFSGEYSRAYTSASRQIRFIVPFVLPFLIFTLLSDLFHYEYYLSLPAQLLLSVTFLALMMVLLPPILMWIWQCKPLPDSSLRDRLLDLCKRVGFKHGGMKIWTVINQSVTAAIVGVVPRFRYVVFTKKILKELSPDSIEAVLAHEIGHSYHKHLLIYPYIILGMIVVVGIVSFLFTPAIDSLFIIASILHPSTYWQMGYYLVLFILFASVVALYFRYLFGYFSRLCERQADLFVFSAKVPYQSLIEAFHTISDVTGIHQDHPSWHHYSIGQRIRFLERAAAKPTIIKQHDRKLKVFLVIYTLALGIGIILLIAPYFDYIPFFQSIAEAMLWLSTYITKQTLKLFE